jgi:hypothetical protein
MHQRQVDGVEHRLPGTRPAQMPSRDGDAHDAVAPGCPLG